MTQTTDQIENVLGNSSFVPSSVVKQLSFFFFLHVVFELFFLVFIEFIAKDWLVSKTYSYPNIALAVIFGVSAVALWMVSRIYVNGSKLILGAFYALFLSAIVWMAFFCDLNSLIWGIGAFCVILVGSLLTTFGVEGTVWRKILNGVSAVISLCLVGILTFFTWKRIALAWPQSFSGDDVWLGNGLGSVSIGTDGCAPANIWSVEWGLATLIALAALIAISLLLVACCLIRGALKNYDNDSRLPLCSVCIGTLFVLFSGDASVPTMLTTNTLAGSAVFFLAVAGIGIASDPRIEKRAVILKSQAQVRRIRVVCGTIFGAIVSVIFVLHIVLSRIVAPYRGDGKPVRYQIFVPLSSISQPMQDATVAMEDGHFYSHHGFDWEAIHRAFRVDIRSGEIKQGGSTLSQQLAKNLFLSNDRTLLRKVEEAAYTIELEHALSKRRILDLYLNTIDYGMGQHGVSAAAQFYFHKPPSRLTLAESACLVGTVPDPMQGEIDPQRVTDGEQTALNRMAFFFPRRYNRQDVNNAMSIPLDRLVYPFKDAWDRGATEIIPGTWHGVSFYFFANPNNPGDIGNVSASLKPALASFLDDARSKLGLTGIDHLGVYNDRSMRQNERIVSAHAFGQAIDISGFRFKDESEIKVADHSNPNVLAKLNTIEACLNRYFPVIVDWRDDPKWHQTHFHCEVRGSRSSAPRAALSAKVDDAQ